MQQNQPQSNLQLLNFVALAMIMPAAIRYYDDLFVTPDQTPATTFELMLQPIASTLWVASEYVTHPGWKQLMDQYGMVFSLRAMLTIVAIFCPSVRSPADHVMYAALFLISHLSSQGARRRLQHADRQHAARQMHPEDQQPPAGPTVSAAA